ncbi:MAG: ABC-2 family transporter protein [Planctomycetes bacterium]|nr:ABC-2 family transporter protein [Planctomycetota bacterium]
MLRHLKLILRFMRLSVQTDAAYRFDWIAHLLMAFVQLGTELLGVWTVFSNTTSLAGWNAYEILALLGVFRIITGTISLLIAPNMRALMEDIRTGGLDFLLLKPVSSQFYASVRRIVIWKAADVLLGVALLAYASTHLSRALSPAGTASFVVMLAAGVAIIYSVWLALGTCAFWLTKIGNIEMVFWNLFEAGRYPVDIYRPWVRWGLTYLIPLAMLTTFPAAALVGKAEPVMTASAIAVAALALTAATLFWRFGLRHYTGASA